MKILSVFLLTLMFIMTGCGDSGAGVDAHADTSDISKYLDVAVVSKSNAPVGIEQYVMLTFSAFIDETTVDSLSAYIEDENKLTVPAVLKVSENKISIIPNEFFLPNKPYTVIVTVDVEDISGRTLENTFTFDFLTASAPDQIPPSLLSVTPANNTSADKTTDIMMTFDESIAGDGVLQLRDSDTNAVVIGRSTISDNTLHFIPDSDLIPDANYTVTLVGTIEDLAGNVYGGLTSWDFSVTPLNDLVPPVLVSHTPDEGAEVSKTTDIVMAFDESIAGDGVLQLRDSDTNAVVIGTSTISDNTLRFIPDSDLIPDANYTVTLVGTVEDLAGNAYGGLTSWDFSVIPASELKVISVTRSGRVIRIEFSADLNTSTVSESDFAIDEGLITFDYLIMLNDYTVKFVADSTISGDENISVSGTIEDIYGNNHNNGVPAVYPLGYQL